MLIRKPSILFLDGCLCYGLTSQSIFSVIFKRPTLPWYVSKEMGNRKYFKPRSMSYGIRDSMAMPTPLINFHFFFLCVSVKQSVGPDTTNS